MENSCDCLAFLNYENWFVYLVVIVIVTTLMILTTLVATLIGTFLSFLFGSMYISIWTFFKRELLPILIGGVLVWIFKKMNADCKELILAILAILAVVVYFLKPDLKIYEPMIKIKNESDFIINVKVKNNSFFWKVIEPECEILISRESGFDRIVKTLELLKPNAISIDTNKEYIFKTLRNSKENPSYSKLHQYKYIKIKILARNPIGIKKLYCAVFPLTM